MMRITLDIPDSASALIKAISEMDEAEFQMAAMAAAFACKNFAAYQEGLVRRNVRRRRPAYRGICADAAALGVSRQHLYEVLRGRRDSRGLKLKYRERKTQQQKAARAA